MGAAHDQGRGPEAHAHGIGVTLMANHSDMRTLLRSIGRQLVSPSRKRSARRAVTNCIFCGGQPTTNEHIWPRWSHAYLPKGQKKTLTLVATQLRDRTDIEYAIRGGDPHDWQVKCVDERCNNGWMRRIENRAKPIVLRMIRDSQTRISDQDQRVLASWVAIKAVVSEFYGADQRISHRTQRRRLRKTGSPPLDTWRIWIAQYSGPRAGALWNAHRAALLPAERAHWRKAEGSTYFNTQVLTYVVGKVFIHLIRSSSKIVTDLWRFDPRASGNLCRIWPPTGLSILWPTPSLTETEARYVANAFRDFIADVRSPHRRTPP